MELLLKDREMRAWIRRTGTSAAQRDRLTLEYPADERYQARVRSALADLLRSPVPATPEGRRE